MPSTWFKGGVEALSNVANGWNNASNMRASIVGGTAISVPSTDIYTLQQFIDAGNSLLGTEATLPGKTSDYDSVVNRRRFFFNPEISLGTTTFGTDLAGVVYYDGTSASPGATTVWACQETHIVSQGGDTKLGTSGNNMALEYRATASGAGPDTLASFHGSIRMIELEAAYWDTGATWLLGYALVESATAVAPNMDWEYMSSTGSVIWCTGGEPNATGMPTTPSGERIQPVYAAPNYDYSVDSIANGRTEVRWDQANLSAGEQIVAVCVFAYESPYNAATARIIHWDNVVNTTIEAGRDVVYISQVGQTPLSRVIVI